LKSSQALSRAGGRPYSFRTRIPDRMGTVVVFRLRQCFMHIRGCAGCPSPPQRALLPAVVAHAGLWSPPPTGPAPPGPARGKDAAGSQVRRVPSSWECGGWQPSFRPPPPRPSPGGAFQAAPLLCLHLGTGVRPRMPPARGV